MEDIISDFRLLPFNNHMIIGTVNSGKTYLCSELALQRDKLFTLKTDGCIYFYQQYQPIFDQLKEKDPEIKFVSDIDEFESLLAVPHMHIVIFFDDYLVRSLYEQQKYIVNFFLNRTHHSACSVIFQSQLLFPKNLKSLSLNSSTIVLLKSSNQSQIHIFLRQISPYKWKQILQAYNECVDGSTFGYFVLNLNPQTNRMTRFRDFLIPRPGGRVFVPK